MMSTGHEPVKQEQEIQFNNAPTPPQASNQTSSQQIWATEETTPVTTSTFAQFNPVQQVPIVASQMDNMPYVQQSMAPPTQNIPPPQVVASESEEPVFSSRELDPIQSLDELR